MIALLYFVLAVLAAPFKSKSRLEAEDADLREFCAGPRFAGRAVERFGTQPTFWGALALAGLGLPLLLVASLPAVIIGLMLVGVGTFFAQAAATGFVGRAATSDRGSASGIYLACYFFGGLVGSAVLGQLFDRFGWTACVSGIALALVVAALLAFRLKIPRASSPSNPADFA